VSTAALVSPTDIEAAARRIDGLVRRTPVIGHGELVLKLELLQHAGSFKPRGAANRVLAERERTGSLPAAGLVTASGGNHGAAVAYVARALGLPAEVFVPSTSPAIKRDNIARFGATVRVVEGYYDDAQAAADRRQQESGALMVHPFDHADTVAGQGTMARELEEQVDGMDTVVVATGGGGFIAGQAAWFENRVRVVSVEPERSQALRAATLAGRPVPVSVSGLGSDSLGARQIGAVPWDAIQRYVDDAVTVSEDDLRRAQRELWDELRLVAEPGGAAALAAVRSGAYRPAPGERVVVVVCGSNCDPCDLARPVTAGPSDPAAP
jgi:threonine dehydratase